MKDSNFFMLGNMKLKRRGCNQIQITYSPSSDSKDWICTVCGAEGVSGETPWHMEDCLYALRQVIADLCKHVGTGPGW